MKYDDLTGHQKTAILMVAIGVEAASSIYKTMPESEIEKITVEITNLEEIPSSIMDKVVEEFFDLIKAQEFLAMGGIDYAMELLQRSLGDNRAQEIIKSVLSAYEERSSGFNLLKVADTNHILNLISNEHPQTIALVLAFLDPKQAATIIQNLDPKIQGDVVYRIATMEKISSDLLDQIGNALKDQIESAYVKELNEIGGKQSVAEMLNLAGKGVEKSIMDSLNERSKDLAVEIRALMFTFEDIQKLDDRSLQRFLKEVETKLLTVALKGATEEMQEKIFGNMSARASTMIREEMEFMGPLRVKEVDDAQRQLIDIIRSLEDEGEIVIASGDGEDEFV